MKKFKVFFDRYIEKLHFSITNTEIKNLEIASNIILKTIRNKKKIFICGNGGSAAIANHYISDYLKLFREKTKIKSQVYSFSSNIELITAISNDISYDKIFSYQAESLCNKGDLIIIISSSGNSKNIINLLKYANKKKFTTIGFSGFKGGYLKKKANVSVHINVNNYGISEDSHHILMHIILQYLISKLDKRKLNIK